MHEVSLVRSLLTQVEQLREKHGGTSVQTIEVEVGPLSGVEALLVRDAFELLVSERRWPSAGLIIREIDLTAECRDCQSAFVIESFRFECPVCHSRSVCVTAGDEFRLLNVTLETGPSLVHRTTKRP